MRLKIFNYKIVNSTNDLAIKIIKNSNNKSGIVIAAFYYLRIIKVIYFDEEREKYDTDHSAWLKISLAFSTLLILLYFIFPSKLMEIVSRINII